MNKRAISLIATLTATLISSIYCPPANAALIPLTGAGNFSVTARTQDVMIAGQIVHAMIYEDDNNPLANNPNNVPIYSNGIPVLVMRLNVGQMVTCKFTNKLPNAQVPEGASIHWHGIELDNDSDGTAVTQDSVLENQTYTYRFVASRPGLFWFHSHMVPGDTLWAGMYGVIIVQSDCEAQLIATNGLPVANVTFTLAMSDIEFLSTSYTNTSGMTDMVFQAGSVGRVSGGQFQTINQWIHDCGASGGGGGVAGDCGTASLPGKTVLVNGYNPNVDMQPTFNVQSGQMIRLQLLNEALTRSFYLELEKTNYPPLIRIGGQGGLLNNARLEGGNTAAGPTQNNYTPPWNTLYDKGAILLSSGMRSDVVLTIPPGLTNGATVTLYGLPLLSNNRANGSTQWPLMQQITTPYPIAYFNVTGPFGGNNPPITDGSPLLTGTNCMVPNLTNGNVTITNFITPAPFAGSSAGTIRLTQPNAVPSIDNVNIITPGTYPNGNPLDGNLGNGTTWSVPRLPTSRYAHVGDLLQLVVTNQTGSMNNLAHPFHLHGFSMQPVSMVDGAGQHLFGYNEFLDTIDVYSGQALVFNVRLDDRNKYCDQSSGTGVGLNSGPVLAPCAEGTPGGALGRWLFHCHIAAHGVLGMMGEIVVLGNEQQSMTFQPPDTTTNGVDVLATAGTGSQTVADDFQWLNSGPISHVTIWGSWTNNVVDPNATFELKFWTDVPAFNGTPSRPGWQAWEQLFPPGTYSYSLYAIPPYEGFYDPSKPPFNPQGDNQVFQYDFDFPDPTTAFYPPAGSLTNWLSVTAYPTVSNVFFGWKTCPPPFQWNDDASWSTTTYGPNWTDLHYPFGHPYYPFNQSMDMAFQLFIPGVATNTPTLSVVVAPPQPVLSASMSGGQLTISWSGGGILQYADEVTGPWYDVDFATSPYVAPTDGPQGFYRVRMP